MQVKVLPKLFRFTFILLIFILHFELFAQGEDDFSTFNFAENITNVGTSAAAFLEIGIGARAQSMGGAFTAIVNDATALYWNPAGISRLPAISLTANHANWLAGTKFQFFGLVIPVSATSAFGFGVTALDYMDQQPVRTIFQPEGTGEFYGASDLALSTTFSMNLTDRFSIGISGKYIRQSIWNEKADGFGFDIGVLYKTQLKGFNIGTSISNFGTDMKMDGRDLVRPYDEDPNKFSNDKLNAILKTDAFSLPLIFRFGLAYSFLQRENHTFTAAVDLIHPSNNVETMNVGFEYLFMNFFAIRAGYESLFDNSSEHGLTAGFGLIAPLQNFIRLSLNYAYSNWGVLGNVQRFSIDFHL